jgi:hypothetical protein
MNGFTRVLKVFRVIVACAAVAATVGCVRGEEPVSGHSHVVLIGASIGQDWRLAQWAERTGATGISAESIAVWQFDKSKSVDEVLMRPKRKFTPTLSYFRSLLAAPPRRPSLVILKECSSYFPSDLAADKKAFESWTQQLRAAHVKVMLATVVPVTRARSEKDPGKQQGLSQFNEWVRDYAARQGLPVLDLDAALREGGPGSFLRDDYTSGDGSHLNATAYAQLDRTLLAELCGREAGQVCGPASSVTAAR